MDLNYRPTTKISIPWYDADRLDRSLSKKCIVQMKFMMSGRNFIRASKEYQKDHRVILRHATMLEF